MAAPRKPNDKKRNANLPSIRCTNSERKQIEQKAAKAGMSLTEYMLNRCLNYEIVVRESSKNYDVEMVHQLQRIGNNLNQLLKNLHIKGRMGDSWQSVYNELHEFLHKKVFNQ